MKKAIVMLVVLVAVWFATGFAEPTEIETVKVTAGNGDTVWTIAEEQYSKGEIRPINEFVWEIRKDNDLLGEKMLQAGQELTIRIHKRK